MLSDPVKFFDGLVRGIVLTFYDIVVLSLASLAFPFVRKTKRFWPGVLSISRRVSSLTLLLIWSSIFFSLFGNDLPGLVTRFATNRDAGSKSLQIIFSALVSTVLIDIAVRSLSILIKNPVRRNVFRELWRFSIAGVFFFASLLMLLGPTQSWLFGGLEILVTTGVLGIPNGFWMLLLPGLSVGLVTLRGFGLRYSKLRLAGTVLYAVSSPIVVSSGAGYPIAASQRRARCPRPVASTTMSHSINRMLPQRTPRMMPSGQISPRTVLRYSNRMLGLAAVRRRMTNSRRPRLAQ